VIVAVACGGAFTAASGAVESRTSSTTHGSMPRSQFRTTRRCGTQSPLARAALQPSRKLAPFRSLARAARPIAVQPHIATLSPPPAPRTTHTHTHTHTHILVAHTHACAGAHTRAHARTNGRTPQVCVAQSQHAQEVQRYWNSIKRHPAASSVPSYTERADPADSVHATHELHAPPPAGCMIHIRTLSKVRACMLCEHACLRVCGRACVCVRVRARECVCVSLCVCIRVRTRPAQSMDAPGRSAHPCMFNVARGPTGRAQGVVAGYARGGARALPPRRHAPERHLRVAQRTRLWRGAILRVLNECSCPTRPFAVFHSSIDAAAAEYSAHALSIKFHKVF
jgi:hypothetical protein